MTVGSKLWVGENPWQCKCWELIKKWIPDQVEIIRDQERPICVFPLNFVDGCVSFVEEELIEHYNSIIKRQDSYEFCPIFKARNWVKRSKYIANLFSDTSNGGLEGF